MANRWQRYLRGHAKELGLPLRTPDEVAALRAEGKLLPGDKWLNERDRVVTYIGTAQAWSAWDRASISGYVQ